MSDYSAISNCPDCKHDLKGSQPNQTNHLYCPECGLYFDPSKAEKRFLWSKLNVQLFFIFTAPSVAVPILVTSFIHSMTICTLYTWIAFFFWPALLLTLLRLSYINHCKISIKPPSIPFLILSGILVSIPGLIVQFVLFAYFIAGASSV